MEQRSETRLRYQSERSTFRGRSFRLQSQIGLVLNGTKNRIFDSKIQIQIGSKECNQNCHPLLHKKLTQLLLLFHNETKTKEQIVNPLAKQCIKQKLECMLQSQCNLDNLKCKIYFCQWVRVCIQCEPASHASHAVH